jgi:ribose/xylose/arabinose/galactoside ABC-type transport system permease subunit
LANLPLEPQIYGDAKRKAFNIGFLKDYGSLIGMAAVLVIFQIVKPNFLSGDNILGVFTQSAILLILSLGLMMVMSVRGVDLSVAQIADAAAIIAASSLIHDLPVWMAYGLPILFGLIIGMLNGFLMSYMGVPAIIGSLGVMFIIRSAELMYTKGAQPQILFTLPPSVTEPFLYLGQGKIGSFPVLILFTIVIVVLAFILKERTVLGRHMDAINGNVRSSFLASVNVKRVFASAFITSGVLAAAAGVVMASRAGIAVPRAGESYLLDAFVAVYLGTLASKNNKMNIIGTVIGALFVGFLGNWLTLMGVGASFKSILNGCFILLAIAVGALRKEK